MGHTFPISSDQSAQSSEPTTASALPHEMPSPSRLALLSMRKHPRYISEFEEDVIRIDITLPNAKEQDDPYIIDLKEIYIPAIGGVNDTVPLTFFPHWTDAIKATVNVALRRYAVNTYLGSRIARLISELLQFCAYCLINSRAYFSSVTPADIEDLSSSLAYLGWYQALGMDLLFDRVIEKARIDETFRHRIATPSPERAQSVRLNIHVIAQYLGIRVNGYIPRRVYQALSEQLGLEPGGQHAGEEQPTEWSPGRFRSTIDAINMLATLPAGMDRLSFFPFPDANKLAETLSNKEAGRTENITIDEACKLLKTSLELVYGHSVGVIALGEALRKRLEEDRHKGLDSVYSAAELHNYLKSIYPEIRDQYSLPWPELGRITNGSDKEDKPSFLDLIRAVQMGAFTLIGISHGRRKNELLGERSRPYGLYFGCVEAIDPAAQIFKLDVYIEKTIQDWDQFYCNKLIADAVKVLEELSQLFRPIGTARVAANADVDKARAEKLFRYKRFSLEGLSGKWIQWEGVRNFV